MTWAFSIISRTSTDPCIAHTFYPPISFLPIHVLYFPELPPCLYTFLGAACLTHTAIGHHLLFDVPDLSSSLSFEQVIGFSLMHSLFCFLGCQSWVRLN